MCGKSTTSTTNSSPPPQVLQQYGTVTGLANKVASQGYTPYTGQLTAGMNSTQDAAIASMGKIGNNAQSTYNLGSTIGSGSLGVATSSNQNAASATGIAGDAMNASGTYEPYFNSAEQGLGSAASLYGQGSQTLSPGTVGASQINQYMSPYQDDVIQATEAQLNQQDAQQQQNVISSAIGSGNAFGGDRMGVAQAALAGQQDIANNSTLSNLYNQNYSQALSEANNQQQIGLAAQEQTAANQLTAGQGMSGIAAEQGNLGTAAQNNVLNAYNTSLSGVNAANNAYSTSIGAYNSATNAGSLENSANSLALNTANAQLGAGTLEQQTQQNALNAQYQQFENQIAFPYQQVGWLGDISEGIGTNSGGTSTTTQPAPFFSDERLKDDAKVIGKTNDGQPIYRYRYKGEKDWRIGLMAQDVLKKHPEAVSEHQGYLAVDYKKATDDAASKRAKYAFGGGVGQQGAGYGMIPGEDVSSVIPGAGLPLGPGVRMPTSGGATPQNNVLENAIINKGVGLGLDQVVKYAGNFLSPAAVAARRGGRIGGRRGAPRFASGGSPDGDLSDALDVDPIGVNSAASAPTMSMDLGAATPAISDQMSLMPVMQMDLGAAGLGAPANSNDAATNAPTPKADPTIAPANLGSAAIDNSASPPTLGNADVPLPPPRPADLGAPVDASAAPSTGGQLSLGSAAAARPSASGPSWQAPVYSGPRPEGAPPDPANYPVTREGQAAFIRDYSAYAGGGRGVDPGFALGVAGAEGLNAVSPTNANGGSYVDIDPTTGKPFSFGAFQLNVRNGLGADARAAGIDPADPAQANQANKFALDYMATQGLGPWKGDKAVMAYQGGQGAPQSQALSAIDGASAQTPQGSLGDAPISRGGLFGSGIQVSPDVATGVLKGLFGMLASPSHTLAGAIGTGGLVGIDQYMTAQAQDRQNALAQSEIAKNALGMAQGRFTPTVNQNGQLSFYDSLSGAVVTPQQRAQLISQGLNPAAPMPTVAPSQALQSAQSGAGPAPAAPAAGAPLPASGASAAAPAPNTVAPAAPANAAAPSSDPVAQAQGAADANPKVSDAIAKRDAAWAQAAALDQRATANAPINPTEAQRLTQQANSVRAQGDKWNDVATQYRTALVQPAIEAANAAGRAQVELGASGPIAAAKAAATAPYDLAEVTQPNGAKVYVSKSAVLNAANGGAPLATTLPGSVTKGQEQLTAAEPEIASAMTARQEARQRLNAVSQIVQNYETGEWADHKADLIAKAKALGLPIQPTDTANPTAFQEFVKNQLKNVFSDVKSMGGQPRVAEIEGFTKAAAGPVLQPGANAAILGQGLGILDSLDKRDLDYINTKYGTRQPGNAAQTAIIEQGSRLPFDAQWNADPSNSFRNFVDAETKNITYKGQPFPKSAAEAVPGQVYQSASGQRMRWTGTGWVPAKWGTGPEGRPYGLASPSGG